MFPEPPKVDEEHLVADYVEYCCLLAIDGEFSASDAEADRAREEELDPSVSEAVESEDTLRLALGMSVDESAEDTAVAAITAGGAEASTVFDTPLPRAHGEARTDALTADVRAVLTQDVVRHLLYRAHVFGERYPFDVDPSGALRVRSLARRDRRLYVFLLVASNLRNFTEPQQSVITKAFERLAVPVMRAHATGAEVHLFGTSDGGSGRYTGALAGKVVKLAEDLRIRLEADLDKISPMNTGDQGLDAVVWFDTKDRARTGIIIFVQCACSVTKWPSKIHEAGEDAFAFWFHFYSPVTNLLMIPFCFREIGGDWFNPNKMKKGVLFDRVRILLTLDGSGLAEAVRLVPAELLQERFSQRTFGRRSNTAVA